MEVQWNTNVIGVNRFGDENDAGGDDCEVSMGVGHQPVEAAGVLQVDQETWERNEMTRASM